MQKPGQRVLRLFMASMACANLTVVDGWAQSYPARPIRMIVGFVAGGATDISARLVAQKMSQRLGQNVIVDNRGGASGTIAIEAVVASAADGYTLLLMPSTVAVLPVMRANLSFNLERDLAPVSLVAAGPGVLVRVKVRTQSGAVHETLVMDAKGTPAVPFSKQDVKEKFRSQVADVIGAATCEQLLQVLDDFESLDDVARLMPRLVVRSGGAKAGR